jgi:hypothetical protein
MEHANTPQEATDSELDQALARAVRQLIAEAVASDTTAATAVLHHVGGPVLGSGPPAIFYPERIILTHESHPSLAFSRRCAVRNGVTP